jgi:parallel beta-helix repeat protein
VSHSSDITVTNNQAARNRLYGVRVTESQNVHVRGNLAEGNEGGGILFDALMDGTREIEMRDNVSRNGGYGIEISH